MTHQVKSYLHHGTQAGPVVEERDGIYNLYRSRGYFPNEHSIDGLVRVLGSMQKDLHVCDMRQSIFLVRHSGSDCKGSRDA